MNPYKILVVDDESSVRRVLSKALAQGGYEVMLAASGEEALELLRNHQFDTVVLDLRMPGMSGQTLFHLIVSQWPALARRIVVMSGDIETADEDGWLSVHAPAVISKPFNVSHILDVVRAAIDRRREANGQ